LGTGGAIALGLQGRLRRRGFTPLIASDRACECPTAGICRPDSLLSGFLVEPLNHSGQVSGMVANPPHIPSTLVPQLQPEVAHHEPQMALDGGADGLNVSDICRNISRLSALRWCLAD